MLFINRTVLLWIYLLAVNLLSVLLRYFAYSDYFVCFACKEMDTLEKSYDYIIVGSGSAGSILANRLSEDENSKILLLEAGSDGNSLLNIPAMGPLLQKSIYDWQYQTTPQKGACLALENNMSNWPRGKIIGGTNMLNNMVYVRGHPEDFSAWGYNYTKDILPYFEKLEESITISALKFATPLSNHILEAAKSLGFKITDDLDCQPGFAAPKTSTRSGQRYGPIHKLQQTNHKNLTIRTNTLVEKVLFRSNLEAYGVKYSYLGDKYNAKATKGVILAAGVIGTPKILLLSGIGPKAHLNSLKIEPILDLPEVGANLQDHIATGLDLVRLNQTLGLGLEEFLSPYSAYEYFFKKSGPWTTIGCENLGFVNFQNSQPELQFMVVPLGVSTDGGVHLKNLAGVKRSIWAEYFSKTDDKFAISLGPIVSHPRSRGYVRLRDSNPETPPVINPKYLSHPYDINILLKGIDLIKKFVETDSMRQLGAELNRNPFPGCENYQFDTRPYWECYIRHLTITVYHPVGTCALGTVVDYDFQVKSTQNLFVVDGSLLPTLTSGNPNAAIMMLAEKASESIKGRDFSAKCHKSQTLF